MDTDTLASTSPTSFQPQRFYIKESSYKAPHTPAIFREKGEPKTQLEMQVKNQALADNHYEVVIQLNATAKVNERTVYNIEIQQAGIFKAEGFGPEQLDSLLKAYCPTLLYPYLCRAVAEATLQAGFSPLLLSPINFDHLYQQQQAPASSPQPETVLN